MSCYGSFGPISIGDCGAKSSIKVETTSVTKNISNNIQQSVSSISNKTVVNQNQNVMLKDAGRCCLPFKVKQGLKLNQIDTTKFKGDFATNTAKKMADTINNSLDQNTKQINDLLGSTVGPNLSMAIKNAIKKVSESNSFKSSIQSKMSETFANQGQNIVITCSESGLVQTPKPPSTNPDTKEPIPDQGCYVDQEFIFDQVTNNLMETLMKDVMQDEQVNIIANEAKQKLELESKGLVGLVSSLTGPMMWVAIAVVVGLILIVPLVIFAFRVKSKRRYYF